MTITCFDTAFNDQFPAGAAAYAAYIDGGIGNQPNYAYIVSAFPEARHLSIALFASDDADALDVESGASVPSDIPGWFARQVARGVQRPVIYASVSTMESLVRPVVASLPGAVSAVRLWTAHYGSVLGPHVCGPSTCGELSVSADGTQWTSNAMGLVLDQSILADDFFGAPAPASWTETLMQELPEVRQGATGTYVRTVQFQCGERGHAVAVDGSFGPVTSAAVKACQAAAGVAQDGVVGPVTWAALLGVS
jgi:Putative peptidoglycan binding domain